mgnify:FL=1
MVFRGIEEIELIRIIVDSGSDLLPEVACEHDIQVLPLLANVNGVEYRDGIDLERDGFYALLEETGAFPKTSQVSPHAFAEAFKEARDSGDEVIAITLSSALSGTYQSAKLAQAMVGEEGVYVVDSLTATYATAMIAEYACALRDEGLSAKQIVAEIERFKGRVKLVAVLDTLEYLQRGGRLPKAAARLGEAAKLKPVVVISEEGEVGLSTAVFGRKRALDTLLKKVAKYSVDAFFPAIPIYSFGTKTCAKMEDEMIGTGMNLSGRRQIGFVIGSHIGPGAYGVVFVERE